MKAGRPSYHIRSRWVTIAQANGLLRFELDEHGSLAKGRPPQLIPFPSSIQQIPPVLARPVTPTVPISREPDPDLSFTIDFSIPDFLSNFMDGFSGDIGQIPESLDFNLEGFNM
jgi:hypothetical protein